MHPAGSIIIFTVLSGLGFGFLAYLGLGYPSFTGMVAFGHFFIGFALAVGGLISSTFHLGNPQRALLAFTQWRTSWLSREAVLAVIALVFMGLYAAGAVFLGENYAILGYIGTVFSLLTVFATSMMYTQMKSVPRWRQWSTPPLFMCLALGGGAILAGHGMLALVLLLAAGVLQMLNWIQGDGRLAASGSNIGTATGLGSRGAVRAFEPPHTGNNYLLKEMVHVIGRKHAVKLRVIAMALMVVVPALILLMPWTMTTALIAVLVHLAGAFCQRWLFFAEAEHVVGLYYGKR